MCKVFLLPIFCMVVFMTGCNRTGPDYPARHEILRDEIDLYRWLIKVLTEIKDAKTAKKSKPSLVIIAEDKAKIQQRKRKVGPFSYDERNYASSAIGERNDLWFKSSNQIKNLLKDPDIQNEIKAELNQILTPVRKGEPTF